MRDSGEENVTCHMSVICGRVNFHCADAQGPGNKNRRIPEPSRKKISIPLWKPQSIDRCLPFEHLRGRRCSGCIGESIYFIQWRKKRIEGWEDRVAFRERGLSERESFSTLPSTTSAKPREWIRLLSCLLFRRIVNVPGCLRIPFQQFRSYYIVVW